MCDGLVVRKMAAGAVDDIDEGEVEMTQPCIGLETIISPQSVRSNSNLDSAFIMQLNRGNLIRLCLLAHIRLPLFLFSLSLLVWLDGWMVDLLWLVS